MLQLEQKHKKALKTLETLQCQKETIETTVIGLQEPTLDLDLLDEKARSLIGYSKPNEKIIMEPYQ